MNWTAKWIKPQNSMGDVVPEYVRGFCLNGTAQKAVLTITAMGCYEATLNGRRISDYVLAPGWTSYDKRHQYQTYDVTAMLAAENELKVLVGKCWYCCPMSSLPKDTSLGLIAQLMITYADGRTELIVTDETWQVRESMVRFSELYDGETADANVVDEPLQPMVLMDKGTDHLIPQEGEIIREVARVQPRRVFKTPKGETVVDFGQEVTGYVAFTVHAKSGDRVEISHGEVLNQEGNFYNKNYRSAKAKLCYTCRDGLQTYKPKLTFFGFRYIRLDQFPGEAKPENFVAIAVSSDLRRTGYLRCGDPLVNRLYENVIWGQRCNFLDVPTDCPQRDERLGWTGDAQVFAKTASYNFDVKRFFRKWMSDVAADQLENGGVPFFIPAIGNRGSSAAWGDVAVIVPWQMYLTYGDREILEKQLASMNRWLDYIAGSTNDAFLWTGHEHFGDWLGLDAPVGSYTGSTRKDFIASAFYAHCADLVARTCRVLGKESGEYENLHERILTKFRETFPAYTTQTECVLALHFDLTPNPEATAAELVRRILDCGKALQTGFVGTPYLLYELSRYGYTELAYDLLLRQEFPGWLYAVNKSATTIWEHWDGIMEDGGFWSTDMNSFNHYAYGSVMGWMYEVAAGIAPVEDHPGFAQVTIAPHPDKRLGWLEATLETAHGRVFSGWYYEKDGLRYEIHTPVQAHVKLGNREYDLQPGHYLFFE